MLRIVIWQHHDANTITNKALSVWASEKFGKQINEMTISRILKRKKDLLGSGVTKSMKRHMKAGCPNLESILNSWFLLMQDANVTISDSMLIEKAKMLQNTVPQETEKEFRFSNGWLQDFKTRNGIAEYVRHGEGASAEITDDVLNRIEGLKALISRYDHDDVFNMDETSLFFQLEPNRTLTTRALNGKKKFKNRLSIALTANMTSTIKLPPFVVYKYIRSRAFTRRSIRHPENLGVLWSANSKNGQTGEVDVYNAITMLEKAWRVDPFTNLKRFPFDTGIIPNMTVGEYIDFEAIQEIEDPISIDELAEFQALGDTIETLEHSDR
ncbi:hypothetical protein R1sor_014050 [Riccia sorocarpa]|uniref:HTH CENPB-type domain-containing protein n=1 Tax=Riccia sorocarpa TaxID=122646 RepID=A0ABD3HA54_9MARC